VRLANIGVLRLRSTVDCKSLSNVVIVSVMCHFAAEA